MNATETDRLYNLLPYIYRQRDAEQGFPLRALLAVINEQADVVEDDIRQMYDNWFIETAQDWVVPYIGELVGYQPEHQAGEPGAIDTLETQMRNRILFPRREVANTIRYRRRKGSLALLEELSNTVAGWPAYAVEFFKRLGWTQNINHRHLERARTVDVRRGHALDRIDGPYDTFGHTVDVRRINSNGQQGRFNIPSVGLFTCRLKSLPSTRAQARSLEKNWHCFGFSPMGNDMPLFTRPESGISEPAGQRNLPAAIPRRELFHNLSAYYGEDKSFAIWVNGALLPASSVVVADLTGLQYQPRDGQVAVDPVRGQMHFSPTMLPKRNERIQVSVTYHYGFSAEIGGGEYDRQMIQARDAMVIVLGADPIDPMAFLGPARTGNIAEKRSSRLPASIQERLQDALRPWTPSESDPTLDQQPKDAVIEIESNDFITIPFNIKLNKDHSLQIRAGNHYRPVLSIPDLSIAAPDAFNVTLGAGSCLTLDGLMIANRPVYVTSESDLEKVHINDCRGRLIIRHCTLVPGWGLDYDCNPNEPTEPSLELDQANVNVRIEHSILGAIQVEADDVGSDPILIHVSDSIIDATEDDDATVDHYALCNPDRIGSIAHVSLIIQRSTIFGMLAVHAIELAENSIFNDCVNVARRQIGCMRFCYIPHGCRTPKRYHCQPETAEQARENELRAANPKITRVQVDFERQLERERLKPQFTSTLYGVPTFCQLSATCADEIKRGADDESELGVFHDLFQPQREANLRARLDEFSPAGMNAGIIFVN